MLFTDKDKIVELLKKNGFDKLEKDPLTGIVSGYPEPLTSYKIIYDSPSNSLENHYFYILNFIKQVLKYPEVEKINDVYTSSTMSSLFGNAMQKLGNQQDRATSIMANIGRLVLDIFKNVYELRKIDERLGYFRALAKGSKAADVALKGIWADNVDSQSKTEASIMVLAQKAGFAALPDAFFRAFVKDESEIDSVVSRFDFSESLKSVLKRKLFSYCRWRTEIKRELSLKRAISLRMLRQHYNSIKLYSYWLKPYLININNLQMYHDFSSSPDLVNSFEGNISDIEILAKKKNGDKYSVILVDFFYRTHPFMQTGQDYSKYPIHIGRLELSFRTYLWSKEQIESFKRLKDQETFELVDQIGANINETLSSLGKDFEKYLKEAEGVEEKSNDKNSKDKKPDELEISEGDKFKVSELFEPFTALGGGLSELFGALFPKPNKKPKDNPKVSDKNKVVKDLWLMYKTYKKVHKLPSF